MPVDLVVNHPIDRHQQPTRTLEEITEELRIRNSAEKTSKVVAGTIKHSSRALY